MEKDNSKQVKKYKYTNNNDNTNTNFITDEINLNVNQIFPFIDEMVNIFYTTECNDLIEKAIQAESDKSIFMMYIMLYFGIHLKLESENDEIKKNQIKILLTDLIKDHNKRRLCIEMFQSKFQNVFSVATSKKIKL